MAYVNLSSQKFAVGRPWEDKMSQGRGPVEDLERYLEEMVGPTLEDFEANPMSRRHAFLACVVIAHAVDYLEHPRGPNQRRNKLKKQSKDFRLVDQIAHAFKHVRSSLKQSQVIVRPPAYWGNAVWGFSQWDDKTGGITVDNEVRVDLLGAAKNAVTILRDISQTPQRSSAVKTTAS
jgi:hypothetical protein